MRLSRIILIAAAAMIFTNCLPPSSPPAQEPASPDPAITLVYNWLKARQNAAGLLPSAEYGTAVSLYDNALAALAFCLMDDPDRTAKIFTYFENRRSIEITGPKGGFFQFRSPDGTNTWGDRWLGDNAWLLIALNQYRAKFAPDGFTPLRDTLQ
jgi:hypothetical protein